jgi:hypothetical protein
MPISFQIDEAKALVLTTASGTLADGDILQLKSRGRLREQFGFRRTVCTCALCQVPCRHIPGGLDVADLIGLCPPDQDVFAWSEQHLRALEDTRVPTLVPARQPNGACHWLVEGRCAVHELAPYGCAFFDAHMTAAEAERRSAATMKSRLADQARHGLYYRVWLHLYRNGLVAPLGDKRALVKEQADIRRSFQELAGSK